MHQTIKPVAVLAIILFSAAIIFGQVPKPTPLSPQVPSASPSPTPRIPDVPFVPTPPEVVDAMLTMAEVTKDDVLYDLGSGDGRIVIAAAKKYGATGVGIDLSADLVAEAKAAAAKEMVLSKVTFIQGDLFEQDLTKATVITLYLLPTVNLKLRPTLLKLKPGTRIVSHAFDMGDWKPEKTETIDGRTIYFWRVPRQK